METLTQLHKRAIKEKWAMPHFNFSSLEQLEGIIDALRETKSPALVGTSEGERDAMGLKQVVALVESFRKEGIVVFLNADHSHSVDAAKKAVEAGYDSIHIDLSKKSFKENVEGTREVVKYSKKINSKVEVEGELGYLVTDSSKIYKEEIEIPEESYTKIDEAVEFVKETGVDRFAPAIGNLHGIAANKPVVHFKLVQELRKSLPDDLTLVLHGGSGINDEDIKRLVSMGVNNIHFSTELRVAYTEALREELKEKPEETAPYKYLDDPRKATVEIVKQKIALFGSAGRV